MKFEFHCPTEIIFGPGVLKRTGDIAGTYGKKALIVCGKNSMEKSGSLSLLLNEIEKHGIDGVLFDGLQNEPAVDIVDTGVKIAVKKKCDIVISMGGGSAVDLGKAISGIVTNGDTAMDYLEGVGYGKVMNKPSLPFIAIPTTAGTGSEVTKNAVITSVKHKVKKSIRNNFLFPEVALVDPELTISLPPEITAHSGMDALTQLIEAYVSGRAQPIPSALALHGIGIAGKSLEKVYLDGKNLSMRENMSFASMLSGIALANSGLGAVHGLSAELGALFDIPHGLICGILLPEIMSLNISSNPEKFGEIGSALTGLAFKYPEEGAEAGLEFIKSLKKTLSIDRKLSEFGIGKEDIDTIINNASSSSMSGNPRELSRDEIATMLEKLI